MLTIYEVEYSARLTTAKLLKLREIRQELATLGWSMRLLAANTRWSHEWTELDVETGLPVGVSR